MLNVESYLSHILSIAFPWLVAIFAMIVLSVVSDIRKSYMLKEKGFSIVKTLRTASFKTLLYLWLVITAEVVSDAAHSEAIATWSCLFPIGLEAIIVAKNILKPYGYDIDFMSLITFVLKRIFRIGNGGEKEIEEVLVKDGEETKQKRKRKKEDEKPIDDSKRER